VRTDGVKGRLDQVEADLPDGRRFRGARAASEALWTMGGPWRVAALMARLPGAELAYGLVSKSRPLLSRLISDP
jgi:predicted DCC family thiol-disulfide oxidoreductase YuxK